MFKMVFFLEQISIHCLIWILLRIDKNYCINIDESIEDEEYKNYILSLLRMPNNKESYPSTRGIRKKI